MFVLIILVWHWNTCIQYFISLLGEFPDDCWVMQENIKVCLNLYGECRHLLMWRLTFVPIFFYVLQNTSIGIKYSYSSFRAFSQLAWISTNSIQSPTRTSHILSTFSNFEKRSFVVFWCRLKTLIVVFANASTIFTIRIRDFSKPVAHSIKLWSDQTYSFHMPDEKKIATDSLVL